MADKEPKSTAVKQEKLAAFASYDEFLEYTKDRFDLKPGEQEALFSVLIKLQSVGAEPLQVLEQCEYKMAQHDCLDMLRFMMYVDKLDLNEVKDST